MFERKQQGSVLAPLATVTARLMEGTVVAMHAAMKDEVHPGSYARDGAFLASTNPIPESATWAMLIAGFGLVRGNHPVVTAEFAP
jgi:hypothetical protein